MRLIEDMCDTAYDPPAWGMMEVAVFQRAEGALAETLANMAVFTALKEAGVVLPFPQREVRVIGGTV